MLLVCLFLQLLADEASDGLLAGQALRRLGVSVYSRPDPHHRAANDARIRDLYLGSSISIIITMPAGPWGQKQRVQSVRDTVVLLLGNRPAVVWCKTKRRHYIRRDQLPAPRPYPISLPPPRSRRGGSSPGPEGDPRV